VKLGKLQVIPVPLEDAWFSWN